jgi:hypothetical protein
MIAKRASRQQAPAGSPNKPSGPSEGAQPPEPTERNGGTPDDAPRSGQQDVRKRSGGVCFFREGVELFKGRIAGSRYEEARS